MPSNRVNIRPATVSDLPAIKQCALKAYQQYIKRMDREPAPMHADFVDQIKRQVVSVASIENKVVGYVVFYPRNRQLHLENVAVLPKHTGLGIGKTLIAHVEKYAKDNHMAVVALYTNEAMYENIALYNYLGFKQVDQRIEDGFKRVYFEKHIV